MSSTIRPTMPPPTKAISESTMVQRAASSRLRRMSQKLKCDHRVRLCRGKQAAAESAQQLAQRDRQQQIDDR